MMKKVLVISVILVLCLLLSSCFSFDIFDNEESSSHESITSITKSPSSTKAQMATQQPSKTVLHTDTLNTVLPTDIPNTALPTDLPVTDFPRVTSGNLLSLVHTPESSSTLKGKNYKDIIGLFVEAGFRNIKVEGKGDLILAIFHSEGDIDKVFIGGESNFSKGDTFSSDATVVIRYHSFNTTEEDYLIDGVSPQIIVDTPMPTSKPTEVITPSPKVLQREEIIFGNYKDEPITWIVLTAENDKVLVLTKEIIGYLPFYDKTIAESCTWKESTIRKWLNGSFYTDAFTDEEKKAIIKNQTYDPWPTEEFVEDSLFILSREQVLKYFISPEDRIAHFAPFVESELNMSQRKFNNWWLIDSYSSRLYKKSILRDGTIHDGPRTNEREGVRPALWIDSKLLSKL